MPAGMLSDDDLVRLWYSDETEAEIVARLGINRERLVSAWRRLGFVAPAKYGAEKQHDGRPSIEFGDPLLDRLKAGLR